MSQQKIMSLLAEAKTALDEAAKLANNVDYGKMTLAELCVYHSDLKDVHGEVDTSRKRIYGITDVLSKSILPERFDAEDITKLQVESVGKSFYYLHKASASMPNKEAGYEWLRENGAGDLIVETVNAGTLASHLTKVFKEKNILPPEDVIKYTPYRIMGSSGYTPK